MRESWTYRKLKDVTSLVTDGDWIESRHQAEGGIRLIQTGNVGNGFFKAKDDKPHYISEDTFHELGCTEIFEGDCLVSRLPDPVGRACIIPDTGCRMITAVDCTIIRFKECILPKLFIYYTRSAHYKREIDNNTTGTTRKRISRKNLESVGIPIPPLELQRKIIEELDLLTGIIEKQKQQLKELDTLAQAIFYDMFGNPEFNNKGWETKKISEIGKVITGSTPSTKDSDNYLSNDYCFVKPSDINKDGVSIIDSSEFFVSSKAFANSRQLPQNSVLTTCIGIIGKVGVLQRAAICNQQINAIIPSSCISPMFLAYSILGLRDTLVQMANAPIVPIINKGDFSNVSIPIPPYDLQKEFDEKIKAIESQKEAIKKSITETETLFDYTMNKYFG